MGCGDSGEVRSLENGREESIGNQDEGGSEYLFLSHGRSLSFMKSRRIVFLFFSMNSFPDPAVWKRGKRRVRSEFSLFLLLS